MNKDAGVDMKGRGAQRAGPEKQPMTGAGPPPGGETNGSVKVKVPEDELSFTGLSKEELMKVAGTPGWVRTRWALLVLFWLGWMGMLAGAVAIIVRAPRCKAIPEMSWWNRGPLYQVPDAEAFAGGLEGVESKMDAINQLKVKGLVLGPLHTVQADQPSTLNLAEVTPGQGSQDALVAVLEKAHRKGISVVLDLTPNYLGADPWFGGAGDLMETVKAGAEHWLDLGFDGIKVSNLSAASGSVGWTLLRAAVRGNRTAGEENRALMGVAEGASASELLQLVNATGVDLVLSDLLSTRPGGVERIRDLDALGPEQRSLAWGLGAARRGQLSSRVATPLIRLYQLLLFTMPGTPVFTYGDEIGLQAGQGPAYPRMVWDIEQEPAEGEGVDEAVEAERKERLALRAWFVSLGDLRGKERSLLHGHSYPLYSSASSLAFLRAWDQSERYITAVNWGASPETMTLRLAPTEEVELPAAAAVTLSTDPELKEDAVVDLDGLVLGPGEAVLLRFSYEG
ncbi:amino acid transporter heavy chain SLC3A2-like [Brachionichthys hirsutus]|uniref:amino acid transporter heavy chain SLC3A2-like n=1 Tax=Brachionichthys hirsutus TaxID=412623 RepID=UPI003604369A